MTDPWQQVKYETYLAMFMAAVQVYELRVWSARPSESPLSTAELTDDLAAVTRRLAFVAPAAITAAAVSLRDGASEFVAVIEDLRRDGAGRPVRGVLAGPQRERYDNAQREFGARIDQFAVLARPDIGITGDYLRPAAGADT